MNEGLPGTDTLMLTTKIAINALELISDLKGDLQNALVRINNLERQLRYQARPAVDAAIATADEAIARADMPGEGTAR